MIRLGMMTDVLVTVILGGITLLLIVLSILIIRTMTSARIASGRNYSKTDRTILRRLFLDGAVNIIAFSVHTIATFLPAQKNSEVLTLVIIMDGIIQPIMTPVINGMVTRNGLISLQRFVNHIRKILRRHFKNN